MNVLALKDFSRFKDTFSFVWVSVHLHTPIEDKLLSKARRYFMNHFLFVTKKLFKVHILSLSSWFIIGKRIFSDYKTGFGGQFGIQKETEHKKAVSTYDQQSEKVGTNYKPTKPDSKFFTRFSTH